MTLDYWERFDVSDVPPNNAVAFTIALSNAYLMRLDGDTRGSAKHREYTALLGRALDRMASVQYEDQIENGKIVVKGDDITHGVKVAYDNMLDELHEDRLLTTVDPDWVPDPNAPGWEWTAQGWRPRAQGAPQGAAQGAPQAWNDFEPGRQMPLGQGWGGKRSRRKRSMRKCSKRKRKTRH